MTTKGTTYRVTIRRERKFLSGISGDCWVARDDDGYWRAYGRADKAPATCGRKLAEYLFHPNEIVSVTIDGYERYGDTTVVEIATE
jgi:hypothetical protein